MTPGFPILLAQGQGGLDGGLDALLLAGGLDLRLVPLAQVAQQTNVTPLELAAR